MPLPLLPLIPIIASLVPEAVKWIAGDKAGAAVEQVTNIAREVFGTDDAGTIERAVATDPNVALQFKMAVLAAQRASEEEETKRMVAELVDRQSARSQTVELAKAGSAIAWGAVLVSALSIGLAGAVVWVLFGGTSLSGWLETIATMAAGAAINWVNNVQGYWLGSSAGSAQKTAALEKAIQR